MDCPWLEHQDDDEAAYDIVTVSPWLRKLAVNLLDKSGKQTHTL